MAPLLWYFPISFATIKGRLALEEKKVAYTMKKINILLGDNLSADYLKANPKGTVPTLKLDDGTLITDSGDIVKYADSIGEHLGGSEVDYSKVEYWLATQPTFEDNLYTFAVQGKGPANLINGFKIKIAEHRMKQYPDIAELYQKKIDAFKAILVDMEKPELISAEEKKLLDMLDTAEKQLTETKFLAGPVFSMADVIMMTLLVRVELVNKQKEFITPRGKLAAYWEDCKTRESYKTVVAPHAGSKATPLILSTVALITIRNLFRQY